jgi:glycosyltransferase involved in cell wall biosynthesis
MHIGFVTSHFPFQDSQSVGGIGTSIKNLSDELIQMGHSVTIFVYGQNEDAFKKNGDLSIFKIKNVTFKGLSWFLTRKKIQKIVNKQSLDILECPDWEGISSFINSTCPLVIRLNGSDSYFCHLENRAVKFKNKFQEHRALHKANGIISVSQFTADVTKSVFNLKKSMTIIPNGINLKNFTNAEDTATSESILLYFGGLIRKKGVLEIPHYFNKVIEKIPSAKLFIVGKDMPDTQSGASSTQQLMVSLFSEIAIKNVVFTGSIPYSEIKTLINLASVCIFPSFAEALPVSWIEAMALKKPIVASNIGWSNEIIDDEINGFKINPKSHEAFADKIIYLLKNEMVRDKIGLEARKTIEKKFSTRITAQQSLAFYQKIIKKKND